MTSIISSPWNRARPPARAHARKLRATGRIPAVCYGPGRQPPRSRSTRTALDRLLRKSSAGMNTLIDLTGRRRSTARSCS